MFFPSVNGVLDSILFNGITAPEIATRQLTGRGLPGGRGLLDLFLAKRELHLELHSWGVLLRDQQKQKQSFKKDK